MGAPWFIDSGYGQTYEVDYSKTFSVIVNIAVIHLFITVDFTQHSSSHQNVKDAFFAQWFAGWVCGAIIGFPAEGQFWKVRTPKKFGLTFLSLKATLKLEVRALKLKSKLFDIFIFFGLKVASKLKTTG